MEHARGHNCGDDRRGRHWRRFVQCATTLFLSPDDGLCADHMGHDHDDGRGKCTPAQILESFRETVIATCSHSATGPHGANASRFFAMHIISLALTGTMTE